MKSRGKVVFVNTSFESIFSRLKASDISKRPLLKNIKPAELKEQLHLLYTERLPIYQQATISFDPIKEQLSDLLLDN
jgi:shikimate kinase